MENSLRCILVKDQVCECVCVRDRREREQERERKRERAAIENKMRLCSVKKQKPDPKR